VKLTYVSPDGTSTEFSRDSERYALLKRYTGLAEAPTEFITDRSPFQHGSTLLDTKLTERTVSFDIQIMLGPEDTSTTSVFGDAVFGDMIFGNPFIEEFQALQDNIGRLVRALDALGGPGILYYERDNGDIYRLNCSPSKSPKLDTSDRSPAMNKATIDFIAHDPFWYSGTPLRVDFNRTSTNFFPFRIPWRIHAGTSNFKTLVNDGMVSAPVSATITGPIVNPSLTRITDPVARTGETLALDLELLTGDIFEITTGDDNQTAYYTPASTGVRVKAMNYVTVESVFWELARGPNTVLFNSDTFTAGCSASVQWSNRYGAVF
jgi:hypothetical protein